MAHININGTNHDLTSNDAAEALEVIENMATMMDVIIDAIEYRTAYALDNDESVALIARLALAHHFIASTRDRAVEEESGMPIPAKAMFS